MDINTKVRALLEEVLATKGTRIKFIANKLNWNYSNLVQWRKGNREYSDARCYELKKFLEKF